MNENTRHPLGVGPVIILVSSINQAVDVTESCSNVQFDDISFSPLSIFDTQCSITVMDYCNLQPRKLQLQKSNFAWIRTQINQIIPTFQRSNVPTFQRQKETSQQTILIVSA